MKTVPSIISRFLSPLSFGEGLGVRLLALVLLASCGEQTELEQPTIPNGETVEVTKTLQISLLPMQSVGNAATRAQGEKPVKGEAIHVSYADDSSTRVQTSTENMTSAETAISNAYILQFDGTSPAAILRTKEVLTSAQLTGTTPVACTLHMAAGVKNRVYVVANVPPTKTLTVGTTTLGYFEGVVALAPSTALPATGLPFSACQDIGVGDVFNIFQLRSLLAKLKFTTSTGTLKLMNVSSGYTFNTQTQPGDNAVRPAGMTYNTTTGVTLPSGTTYYVPENLSGRSNISSPVARIAKFAPANSMYILISANSTTYSIYLGDGTSQDFNFTGGYSYNINSTIYGTDATDLRVGTPTFTDLSALGTANCYIVTAANTWYSFNGTVMGNGATTLLPANMSSASVAAPIIPQPLNPIGADVLWETWNTATTPDKGSVVSAAYTANGTMLVRTGAQQGNAVVAARDASNNIIWSWHIWRIDTDPTLAANRVTTTSYTISNGTFDDTGTTTHPGFTMMKLNLGALSSTAGDNLSTGLHYQWGRKDPMPGVAGLTAPNNVAMATVPAGIPVIPGAEAQYTVAQSIAQPTTFLRKAGDWCSTRNDNLWGTPLTKTVISTFYNSNYGSKSIYDPCPAGWRVPPAYVYANATGANCPWLDDPTGTNDNKGRDFKGIFSGTSVWFPASGGRHYSNGTLYNVGSNGYYWVSTPIANNPARGHGLGFGSGYVDPYGQGYRSDGYSCRCVLE